MAGRSAPRRFVLILALAATVAGAVNSAPANADGRNVRAAGMRLAAIGQLQRLGVPDELLTAYSTVDQSVTFKGAFVDVASGGDLNHDGRSDFLASHVRYEITFNDSGSPLEPEIEDEAHTRIAALSGRDGGALWRKSYDDFVWTLKARVGKKARAGALMLHGLTSFVGPLSDRYLRIDALQGSSGRRIWRRSYRSVVAQSNQGYAYTGVPTGIDTFDGLPGQATDVLVGVSDVAGIYSAYVVRTTSLVIRGSDGAETKHPAQDVGVNWFPAPWAVGDVGGSRFDDYVVPSDKGVALPEDQNPPEVSGIVTARTGNDGSDIWTEGGYEFTALAWVYRLGNVVGDRHKDLGVVTEVGSEPSPIGFGFFTPGRWVTYLTDSGAGQRLWRRPAAWPYSPGDIDRDGRDEVVTRNVGWKFGKGEISYIQHAYAGSGHELWHRRVKRSYEPGDCSASCGAGYAAGWLEIGDLQRDGLVDTFVQNSLQQDPGEDAVFNFTVSGKTGKAVDSGSEELQAIGGEVDGRGTDVADVYPSGTDLRIVARTGNHDRRLWDSTLTFDTVFGSSASREVMGLKLDRDDCDDVVVIVDSPKAAIVVAFDGGSGRIKWTQTVLGDARVLSSRAVDHNPYC